MAASTWFADGGVTAFDPALEMLWPETVVLAASNTSGVPVDSQAPTRMQYDPGPSFMSYISAVARIRVTFEDLFAAILDDPANDITVQMYVSSANAHVGIPTSAQIILAAMSTGMVFRANEWTKPLNSPPGYKDVTFHVNGPSQALLQANTKYWIAVTPVVAKPGSSLTTWNPLHTTTPGMIKAVSVWTNRTPDAPVVTSPTPSQVVTAGSTFNLTIVKQDPDAVFSGTTQAQTDTAGVQVQYAARPTAENPTPAWIDLPFADSGGVLRKGWWIADASANVAGEGLAALATGSTVVVKVGTDTPTASQGLLPAGTWQIRVRTFDFGHPFPLINPPLNDTTGAYTASTYPALNTSSWSPPVTINISAQVPAPVPLFPIENAAIPEGVAVNLLWQYRNTAVPPFAQARRSVRIRQTGGVWYDLASDVASSSQTILVTGFSLVSGNSYEWQVQVEDSDGQESTWGDVARFWVVPAPGSGEVKPLPSSTIDGATLGCGTHRVEIYRRGGKERVGEIRGVSYVDWDRVRDDISTSKIVVSSWDIDCGNLLAELEPWTYEVVLTRDNGYSKERVWEGPITLLTYETESVTIHAKDVMAYVYRRIIKQKMSDAANGDTVTSRAARVIQNVMAPDDPNILAYLTVLSRVDDAMQYRTTPAYSRTGYEEVDDMAANAGLDYTTVGRSILLWGTKHRIGTLPEFRDSDLGNTPIVSVYGMNLANRYVVSDGNGVWGEATRLDDDGKDPRYGLVELLSSTWASDSTPESGTYTQAGLDKVRQSFAEGAERSIADRYPAPVVVRVPDNTTVNPDTVLSIQNLVPGVVIPLRSTSTLRTVVQSQKLDSIKVVETEDKETVSITMSPFSRDDSEPDDGDEG